MPPLDLAPTATSVFAFGFGTQELLIIGGIVLVLFGGTKLPELMRGLGQGMREFKRASDGPEEAAPAAVAPSDAARP